MRAALMLSVTGALPRAPARGPSRLSLVRCNKPWKGCPEEGGSQLSQSGHHLAGVRAW